MSQRLEQLIGEHEAILREISCCANAGAAMGGFTPSQQRYVNDLSVTANELFAEITAIRLDIKYIESHNVVHSGPQYMLPKMGKIY